MVKVNKPEIISEEVKYGGKIFKVVQRKLKLEDGSTMTRDVVLKNSSVSAIITDGYGKVYVQEEYRSGINKVTLGFPAGLVEPNESPEEAIEREVLEETGYEVVHSMFVGKGALSEGFTNEEQYIYMCRVDTSGGQSSLDLDKDEHITNGRWVYPGDLLYTTKDGLNLTSMSGKYLRDIFRANKQINSMIEMFNRKENTYE